MINYSSMIDNINKKL